MLFEEKIQPLCLYCQRGSALNEEEILCVKKGVVSPGFHCRGFRYDPLRRTPPRPIAVVRLKGDGEDFSL
ncbi:MAG: hypothetical protein RSC08_03695 [Oscillospiraceae bacterium]